MRWEGGREVNLRKGGGGDRRERLFIGKGGGATEETRKLQRKKGSKQGRKEGKTHLGTSATAAALNTNALSFLSSISSASFGSNPTLSTTGPKTSLPNLLNAS